MLRLKNTFAALVLLATLAPATALAEAGPREVKLETNHIHNSGDSWSMFGAYTDGLNTQGVGYAQDLNSTLSVVASYHFGQTGSDNHIPSGAGNSEGFIAAFTAHQLSAGVRTDLDRALLGWFEPYGSVRATLLVGVIQLDDDPDQDDNLNQVQAVSYAPGARVAAGLSSSLPLGPVEARIDGELGYAYSLKMSAGELGELQFSGLHALLGIGVRF